jgi:hypothetical protein
MTGRLPGPPPRGARRRAGVPAASDESRTARATAALVTVRRLGDLSQHLEAAAGHLEAARAASGEQRQDHSAHVAAHLAGALAAGHDLAANIRGGQYPGEADELAATARAIGLAKALSEDTRAATMAHLLQTVLYDAGHASRHAEALAGQGSARLFTFNSAHCAKHVNSAVSHAAKLRHHLEQNYPPERQWMARLAASAPEREPA